LQNVPTKALVKIRNAEHVRSAICFLPPILQLSKSSWPPLRLFFQI